MSSYLLQHLEKLPYFLAIAHQQSFHRAAETLKISQSALSRSMKQLENDLGVQLFVRKPRGVGLTAEGETLFGFAQQLTAGAKKVEDQLLRQQDDVECVFRLGVYSTIANQFGPMFLQVVQERFPRAVVHLTIEPVGRVMARSVLAQTLDAAIFAAPASFPQLADKVLLKEHFQTYVTADCSQLPQALAGKAAFTFDDFAHLPLFIYKQAVAGQNASLDRLLQDSHLSTHRAFQVNDFQTIRQYVAAGLGFGVLPHLCGVELVLAGALKPAVFKGLPQGGFGHHQHRVFWRQGDAHSERLAELIHELYPCQQGFPAGADQSALPPRFSTRQH